MRIQNFEMARFHASGILRRAGRAKSDAGLPRHVQRDVHSTLICQDVAESSVGLLTSHRVIVHYAGRLAA